MDRISDTLQQFIDLHETGISVGVSRSRESSAQAEAVTEQLVLLALVFGIALAGFASYTILRPLRQLQTHIKQIGQGNFRTSLNIQAPSELRDLVDAVNWMGTKLQELDDMKGEFLAHVSHELRTPMASIQEGTHLLLDEIPGPLSQEQRTTLRIMADSSRRLITLISTILDLSKMDAGMMEYRIIPTDLKRITDMSVNKVQLLADAKHVQLLLEAPAQRVWVMADALRVEQVLDNLLSNALKFSSEGGIVKVLMKPDPRAGVLEVSVTDLAFRPKTCPIFSNVSIKDAQRLNMLRRGAASGWHWRKRWSKHTEDGFGSKAKRRRGRVYDLSYASRNQETWHEGCPPRPHVGSLVLSFPRWMRGLVANPAIFAALFHGGYG